MCAVEVLARTARGAADAYRGGTLGGIGACPLLVAVASNTRGDRPAFPAESLIRPRCVYVATATLAPDQHAHLARLRIREVSDAHEGRIAAIDEQLENPRHIGALSDRGCAVKTVGDFGAQGRPDPDVVRRISDQVTDPFVLVTMDLSVVEDFKGFDWNRYAIAWVQIRKELRGRAVEIAKANTLHKHLERMTGQRPGDHFTYTPERHDKRPPSLASMTAKRI
jgi:hypothetical protein